MSFDSQGIKPLGLDIQCDMCSYAIKQQPLSKYRCLRAVAPQHPVEAIATRHKAPCLWKRMGQSSPGHEANLVAFRIFPALWSTVRDAVEYEGASLLALRCPQLTNSLGVLDTMFIPGDFYRPPKQMQSVLHYAAVFPCRSAVMIYTCGNSPRHWCESVPFGG